MGRKVLERRLGRFRLRTLMLVMVGVALLLAALFAPSESWYMVTLSLMFFGLGIGLAGVCVSSGKTRAFCIGFSILAWMRFLVEFAPLLIRYTFDTRVLFPNFFLSKLALMHESPEAQQFAFLISAGLAVLISGAIGGLVAVWLQSSPVRVES